MKKVQLFEEFLNETKTGYAVDDITDDNELLKAIMKLAKNSKKTANKIAKKLVKLTESELNVNETVKSKDKLGV